MADTNALRQAVEVSPRNTPLLLLLAQALIEECLYAEAIGIYDRVLAIDRQCEAAWIGRCNAAFLAGQLSDAEVRLQSFLEQHAAHAAGWLLMARVLHAQKDVSGAEQSYRKAQSLRGFVADAAFEKLLAIPAQPVARVSGATSGSALAVAGVGDGSQCVESPAGELERPAIRFGDVGGMESVKEEIRMKILYPLQNRDLFKAYGKKIGGGVLMYGPPGCGKTLLSRATAGEIKAGFMAVGLHDVLDMWLGNSEKNLHQLFEVARQNAPCVLFFDEVDALASDRRDMRQSAGRSLINQFLAEMDGNVATNEGVLILAATNAPWHLDPAFLRPGRFDRVLFVPPPDVTARQAIVELMAQGRPVDRFDARTVARKTDGLTGADLKAMFDQAIERCLAQAMKDGQRRVVPITTDDLLACARQLRSSARTWFESAKNYALYSNQSGLYDPILKHLDLRP